MKKKTCHTCGCSTRFSFSPQQLRLIGKKEICRPSTHARYVRCLLHKSQRHKYLLTNSLPRELLCGPKTTKICFTVAQFRLLVYSVFKRGSSLLLLYICAWKSDGIVIAKIYVFNGWNRTLSLHLVYPRAALTGCIQYQNFCLWNHVLTRHNLRLRNHSFIHSCFHVYCRQIIAPSSQNGTFRPGTDFPYKTSLWQIFLRCGYSICSLLHAVR